ncbi:hypothetical protein [Staphylococcus epidermidis]|uniref:hypothetical protein n=1 Tax=Staphylococcus epidermidis TaxID=1282 RepID=UPI0002432C77|nr:hypothetical protein HMPREF9956_0310 [Staphylococcus epidermidis 14.1.R1.SE]
MAEIKTSNLSFKQINAIKILDKELKRDPFLLINFNELVNDLISERESFRKQRDELINDMAETKRKAEAWIDLKTEMAEMYPVLVIDVETTSGDFESGMLYQLGKHLRRMDELDGTHEFQNLLSDLERGSDEKI